ncbi:MAG TPA: methyltransferase domain-containing protein [Conexibacter sp.]
MSATERRTLRQTARSALRHAIAALPADLLPEQDPTAAPQPNAASFAREARPGRLAIEQQRATSRLISRLDAGDITEIERRIAEHPQMLEAYQATDRATRRHLLLHLGIYLLVPAVYEKTGLRLGNPPGDVHAMARGPLSSAGGVYEADLVADALASAGVDIAQVTAGLDFGCSSGRVVRVLHGAFPDVRWAGCDPNAEAIAWAGSHLHGIGFVRSGDDPPLPFEEGSFELVYAISIWSHFEPALGMRWFDEMRRLLAPGGHLVFTTHGITSIDYYARSGARLPEQAQEISEALYRQGWWYKAEFGEAGDWGVVNPAWGTAFLTPEWLLTALTPAWRVLEFAPGRNLDNQDVYVLERR